MTDQNSDKNYPVPSELPQPKRKGQLAKRPLALPGHFTDVHIPIGGILFGSSIKDMYSTGSEKGIQNSIYKSL